MGKTVLLVPSVFELVVGTLYILQDENGELIKIFEGKNIAFKK